MLHTVRGFDVTVNVDGLVEIKLAIGPPMQCMHQMMCVFSAEAGEHDAFLVSLAITVSIFEIQKFSALPYINSTIARSHTCGNEQAIREYGRFFCSTAAVGVFKDKDFVVGDLAGLNLGID